MLGSVPAGWMVTSVGALGEVRLGRQRSPQNETGSFIKPYLRVANVFDGFIDFSDVLEMNFSPREQEIYDLRNGDILLNEGQSLELVGRCAKYVGKEGIYCFQNTLIRYRCSDLLDPDFAYQMFSSWLRRGMFADVAKQTTSIAHLGADRFATMPILVPPIHEQRKIVDVLNSVDESIRSAKRTIAKRELIKQEVIETIVSRGLADTGSGDWSVHRLGDLAETITSGSRGWGSRYSDSGALFIRIGNLTRKSIDLRLDKVVHVIPPDTLEVSRTALRPGDVLISITADLGVIGVVPDDLGEAYVNQHVAMVRPIAPTLGRWIGYYLSSNRVQDKFRMLNDSGAKAGLNLTSVSHLEIAIPDDSDAIVAAVALLDRESRTIKAIESETGKLVQLKVGLVDDLLAGRVRVSTGDSVTV